MKSKSEFIYSTNNPDFTRAILRAGGVSWKELISRPEDYYAANNGNVPGMIYYEDTVKFGKKYQNDILDMIDEYEEDTGSKVDKPSRKDKTQYYNWLSWFAWESVMLDLMYYLEE